MTDNLDRLELLVSRLEQLGISAAPRAPVDPDGTPGTVATGELIESAWGNSVVANIDALYRSQPRSPGPYVGAWPPAGQGWPTRGYLFRTGHAAVALSAFGDAWIDFAAPFDFGVFAIVATPTNVSDGGVTWWCDVNSPNLTGFQFWAMSYEGAPWAGGHPPSQPAVWTILGTVQVDYIAIGA